MGVLADWQVAVVVHWLHGAAYRWTPLEIVTRLCLRGALQSSVDFARD